MISWIGTPGCAVAVTEGIAPPAVPKERPASDWRRRVRLWCSRREWSVRLLNLPVSEDPADAPGLVILQIDGLSRIQCERAMERGHMPFLRSLLRRGSYRLQPMYSGQPTTTPAVLGELFYGVRQAVPAFGFRDHRTGDVVQMFQPGIASRVQEELAHHDQGLLEGGSVYCDIYSGGATDSSFCPATTGWRNLEEAELWSRLALFALNFMSVIRIVALMLFEFVLAIYDCIRGIRRGLEVLQEVLYVPRRVLVNVALREAVAIGAEVDVTRGVRVLHANFLGYDENAHRRGPGSLFAQYALRNIDHALHRIWDAARHSGRRSYQVWIMSDHGQERTTPYSRQFGRSIGSAVNELYQSQVATGCKAFPPDVPERRGDQLLCARWFRRQRSVVEIPPFGPTVAESVPTTVAIGPLGYIYWPIPLEAPQLEEIAQRLVLEARLPLVLAVIDKVAWAWTEQGRFRMPDQAADVLPPNHPYLADVARDFTQLCFHPDAGTFLVSGWRNVGLPFSFVTENGAHGGPGPEETNAFVLLPADLPVPNLQNEIFRPCTLRTLAQAVLEPDGCASGRGRVANTADSAVEQNRYLL